MQNFIRRFGVVAGLYALSYGSLAQTGPADEKVQALIAEGVELYDSGRFDAAIAKYQQALKLQPDDIVAKAELAMTFHQIGKYEQAVQLCRQALAAPGKHGPNIYVTYANCLDALQKPAEAEQAYKDGLKEYPGYYLLLYNLGITQRNRTKYTEAEASFQAAVQDNPFHPGSNLSWGLGMVEEGNRIPAMLALANFLLLEPNSKRSFENLDRLHKLLASGVEKLAGGGTVIRVQADQLAAPKKGKKQRNTPADSFAGSELATSLLSTMDNLPPELASNPVETFGFQFGMLCQSIGRQKDHPAGFSWTHYVPFFSALEKQGHMRTMAYLIHLSDDTKPYVREWLDQHPEELKAMLTFVKEYKWPE